MKKTIINRIEKAGNNSELAHNKYFNELREKEYSRLSEQQHTYLDYTGGNLYGESQIKAHFDLLRKNTFGNPHSTNPTSQRSTLLVDEARKAVLDFFNAEDYYCVFTQNASGALQIIGECYPFEKEGALLLLADNHNSVNGIRQYCLNKKGLYKYVPIQYEDLMIDSNSLDFCLNEFPEKTNKLFAFPAQSNVTGVKHDLQWIKKAQDKGWDVLLDAAAFVPTTTLDLSAVKPDFVSVSFYKIFGYPTGVGCLLVKKSKFNKLVKPWFAGGTVTLVAVKTPHYYLAENHERFENGTVNYLDIPAVKTGIDYIKSIGMNRINERVHSLIAYLIKSLKAIKHNSGSSVVKVFGPLDRKATGGNTMMNFFDSNEKHFSFEDIEESANKQNISIRSGCFCNPGIDEVNSCLTYEELAKYFSSRDKGDYHDMVSFLHKMRGATRVSVGIATTKADLDTFINFVKALRNKTVEDEI
ncbi:MAG: molybdenum cofactor sulfurtransferase [Saprospiraceae bacterium]|jgi:molybdenum cofactor sulfurtransferase